MGGKRFIFSGFLLLGIACPRVTSADQPSAQAATTIEAIFAESTPPGPSFEIQRDSSQLVARDASVSGYRLIRGTPGYWRVAQDARGVWWMLSPDDNAEFVNTVTTVQPYQKGRDRDGAYFTSRDYNGAPNLSQWAETTLDRIYETGFKGLGAWSHPVFHDFGVPMTRDLNVWMYVPPKHKRLYDPQWSQIIEQAIQQQVQHLRTNANLVGYYTDNELDWGDGSSGPGVYFDHLPATDPNRVEVQKVIASLWPTIESFNADWGTTVRSLDELETLPRTNPKAYQRLYSAFLEHMARDYFRITTRLVRKYDPNHLLLGVRFRGNAPEEVVRASRSFTDAQSINYYPADAQLDPVMFRMMHEQSGQPVIISEYAFHSLDGRSGNRNTVGFHAQVPDQLARAEGYKLMTTRLARVPYIIGADWFQWMDEPPSGRVMDGEDVNFGIVDIDDSPYQILVDAIQDTTWRLNDLHALSHRDPQRDVWRPTHVASAVANVPHLSKPIKLNGQLADWPAETRLPGMRLSPTVGLERSTRPLPNINMAWTDDGLYVGLEVFDDDIVSTPANGWWWTRDCVELFIATRPTKPDQMAYDPHCHQFYFVPMDFPDKDGFSGTVGQWHRDGDVLSDHKIPHEDVIEAVRVLPDRYVVEMFIPAKAMHGYDPRTHPALSLNVHVRNFQHATEYFWSAPKEMHTQLRPGTWGTIHLLPPQPGSPAAPKPPTDIAAAGNEN